MTSDADARGCWWVEGDVQGMAMSVLVEQTDETLRTLVAAVAQSGRFAAELIPVGDDEQDAIATCLRSSHAARECFVPAYRGHILARIVNILLVALTALDGEAAVNRMLGERGLAWKAAYEQMLTARRARTQAEERERDTLAESIALAHTARSKLTDAEFAALMAHHREL